MDHVDERRAASADPATDLPTTVIELRRYELQPGRRDDLIELFERVLLAGQEESGMRIFGQFRDLQDPDAFVWVRGFTGMEQRRRSLDAFYTGPLWATHREDANATMIDVSNVLLLRSAGPGFVDGDPSERPPATAVRDAPPSSVIVVTVTAATAALDGDAGDSGSADAGVVIGVLETEPADNTYPRLPVRVGEHVRVVFRRFSGLEDAEPFVATLVGTEHLVLRPTARSWIR